MISSAHEQTVRTKYQTLKPELDERGQRVWAATEALSLGHGGVAAVARATGLAESTIWLDKRELAKRSKRLKTTRRLRHPGGGRKPLTTQDQDLLKALDTLVEPTTRADPMSPLRWTCKSTRRLAEELC
jgi:Rhodopirellula transposase DDE domain